MAVHAPITTAQSRAIPDAPSRRALLGLFAAAPIAAASVSAFPLVEAHPLLARLADHDETTLALEHAGGSEAAWDAWGDEASSLYEAVERLPNTASNAAIKARAIMSIYLDDDLEDMFDTDSTASRLALQVIRGLGRR